MFSSGQTIYKEQYTEFANWNNANGGKLYCMDLGNGAYLLENMPEPTNEELSKEKRIERDLLLAGTDKYMLADFPIIEEERNLYKEYRQYLRNITKDSNFPNIEIKTFEQYKE